MDEKMFLNHWTQAIRKIRRRSQKLKNSYVQYLSDGITIALFDKDDKKIHTYNSTDDFLDDGWVEEDIGKRDWRV